MAENTEVKATNPMDEVVAKMDSESKYKKGQIVHATISQATNEGLEVLLPSAKKEVALSKDELDCEAYNAIDYLAKIGDPIDLIVVGLNPLKLSQKMIKTLQQEEALSAEIEGGKEFTVVCTGSNKGGLVAQFGTYSVFVPAKEIRPGFVKDLAKYEGKTLKLRAIEIKKNGHKKEIIASQRVILQEERDARDAARLASEEEFFSSITVGDIVEGKVERATSFGAFVSVNGFDCLAHISDLSWTGAENVTDVLEIGKVYRFIILKIDNEHKKVSIGYKQLQPQPWDLAAGKYAEGDIVHGKVVRIVPFGAFVELEKGIDGLVHVSQISHEWLENPTSVLSIGEEIDAKVLAFNPDEKKITLSIKALQAAPEFDYSRDREENAGGRSKKKGGKRNRNVSEYGEDEEYREWNDGGFSGASIAELLGNEDK